MSRSIWWEGLKCTPTIGESGPANSIELLSELECLLNCPEYIGLESILTLSLIALLPTISGIAIKWRSSSTFQSKLTSLLKFIKFIKVSFASALVLNGLSTSNLGCEEDTSNSSEIAYVTLSVPNGKCRSKSVYDAV